MPAGATIIGRVAVKVLPDTSTFRADTKRELDRIESRLGPLKVRVDLDASRLGSQVRDAVNDAQGRISDITVSMNLDNEDSIRRAVDKLKQELDKLKQFELDVDLNEGDLRAAIDSLNEELNKSYEKVREEIERTLNGIQIKPELDESEVRRGTREIESLIERISKLRAKITPELDDESRRKVEREIEELQDKVEDVKARLEVEAITTPAALRLALLARDRVVRLFPVVDNGAAAVAGSVIAALSGARALHSIFEQLGERIKNLDKDVPKIAALATAIAGLGASGIASASNLFTLTASLAQIAGAGLALPGILGGIAIGLGATIAVFKDFNKVLPEVAGKLSDLQDRMSERFWVVAETPIRNLINTLLPQFSAGLEKTSDSLGKFFANFSDSLTGKLNGALGGMFADLNKSIEIAAGGTDAFAGIIEKLGRLGASYLPRLATWFVDIATRFDEFLGKAEGDGRLKGWVDGGIAALNDLGSVLSSLGGIFASIASAAETAGGSTLSIFADTLDRIQATVEGPVFQGALVRTILAAHEAFNQIGNISGPAVSDFFESLSITLAMVLPLVGQIIGTLLDGLAQAAGSPAVQGQLVNFFLSVKMAVDELRPVIPLLGGAFAAILDVISTLVDVLGPVLAVAFEAVAQSVINLSPVVKELIKFLGTGLKEAVDTVAPLLVGLTKFLGENETAAKALATLITGTLIIAYTSMAATAVITAATKVIAWLTMTSAAAAGAAGHNRSFAQIIAGWALMALRAVFHGAAVALVWTTQIAARAVAATLVFVAQVAIHVARWTFMAVTAVAQGAIIAAVWVTQIAARAVAATAVVAAQIAIQVARWVFLGAQSLIAAGRVALAWLIAMGPIALVVAAVIALVILIVRNWDTIKQKTSELWNKVKELTSRAWEAVKQKFAEGVVKVVAKTMEIKNKIISFFAGAGRWLVDAGRKIIDGLISGITGAFGKVKDTLGRLTDMLPDWKGPASRDKTLLTGAGQLLIEGLVKGLESKYDLVRDSLKGLTKDMAGTQFDVPGVNLAGAQGGIAGRLAARLDGAESASVQQKVLNYYAAAGSSLGSEEDLFAAASRTRMVGW